MANKPNKPSTQPKPATTAATATQPATTAAPSTKPAAVALQRPAGAAGAKNGNCAAAWAYYNANPALARSAAVKGCVAANPGMPVATARTQYQHWYTEAKKAAAAAAQ